MKPGHGLHIIQSNRLEDLAGRFGHVLARAPLPDPLQPERVVVHDRTVGEWLNLALARSQGVAANVEYRSPGELIWELYRAVGLVTTRRSAYDVEVLQWHIVRILEDPVFTSAHVSLRRYCAAGGSDRRFDLAVRLAALFNRYLIYRMDWLRTWEGGGVRNLGPDEAWQAALWRRLTADLHEPHRAALFSAFLERVDAVDAALLPERVSVFGISSLSPAYVKILEALGKRIAVHVYLLNPSREKWDDIADERYRSQVDLAYSAELMHIDVPHALLGSLGKQGRDFIRFAVEAEGEGSGIENCFSDPGVDTLLHALQSGILRLSEEPIPRTAVDDSIAIHACHSRMREVEVLRDQVLALLDHDRTLRPSDILVLAPDIDVYAPYCEAVFTRRVDPGAVRTMPAIPVDVAERKSGQVNVVVDLWHRLLALPLSRFDADLILDLLRVAPVARAFGISANDITTITGWVEGAGIRWGLDAAQKTQWGLPLSGHFTWEWGLQRMVLGVAMPHALSDPRAPLYHGMLPFDEIEGQHVELLDRFLAFIDAVRRWVADLSHPRTMAAWKPVIDHWFDRFIGDDREFLESREILSDLLEHAVNAAIDAGHTGLIDQSVLRILFDAADAGSQAGARFLGGGMTFASMKPMRPLPYRVIALLGMGDGEFPRLVKPPSFDLMQSWYRYGDRSGRLDDRYLFLELLLSARDRLIVTYVGEDIRSGKRKAMSPVLAEMLEFLGRIAFDDPAVPAYDRVAAATRALVVVHPLQPFSRRYFDGSDPRLFSYAAESCTIAREAGAGTATHHDLFPVPLGDPGEEFFRVRLDDLCRFFGNPAEFLIRRRLGAFYREAEEGIEIVEPLTVGNIERRAVYRALYEHLPAGHLNAQGIFDLLVASAALPVGVSSAFGFAKVMEDVRPFIGAYQALLAEERLPSINALRSFGPWSLEIVHPWVTPDAIVTVKPGKIHEKDMVSFWVRLLATSLVHPRGTRGGIHGHLLGVDARLDFAPVPDAEAVLARLVAAYGEGLRRPLPFFPQKALDFVMSTRTVKGKQKKLPEEKLDDLRAKWDVTNSFGGFNEADDAYISRAFISGDQAITPEFADLSTLIMGGILQGMERTDLAPKKGK